MLKQHAMLALLGTALLTMPALAQSGSGGQSAGGAGGSGQFMQQASPGQWRASQLMGLDVYGSDNQKVGDISEVLLDKSGNVQAVVIGVGGFLGIGEKSVGLPFNAIQWRDQPREGGTAARTGGGGGSGAAGGGSATTGAGGTSTLGTGGGTASGTAGTSGSASADRPASGSGTAAGSASSSQNRDRPDHAMISMSREQLQNAPAFRYSSDAASGGSGNAGGSGARTGSGAK